ncbi:class I SAM-dependent methyltransferase [Bacillus sp. A301a_S52]|nr:class I SAM-dependent methyltransferase [Bacillus sp. A301a_S52]
MRDEQFYKALEMGETLFTGWDFSYIEGSGRCASSLLPWSYGSKAITLMRQCRSLLDMGTGGGEFLSLLQPFPSKVYATEGYAPNVAIAKAKLEPLGVNVEQISDDHQLPFHDEQFDLVLNRHESYAPQEVKRILKTGGIFFTQQVGCLDAQDLNKALHKPVNDEYIDWDLKFAVKELTDEGIQVVKAEEAFPTLRFYDIGAVVYYLKAIPWQIPHFSVDDCEEELYVIYEQIKQSGCFDVTQHRFLIEAKAK